MLHVTKIKGDYVIIARVTSVSETIRKPPLVKAQTALKIKQKNKIWRKTIFSMVNVILTPCNVARSWHWFRQVTAPCNVACGSGIKTVNSPSGSTLQCDRWLWDDMPLNSPVAAPCNVASGSGMTCHEIRPNVRHIGILHMVLSLTISPQSTCHSAPVCEILSKSDHPQQKNYVMSIFKMADLSHIGFYGSNNGFFEKPMYDFL